MTIHEGTDDRTADVDQGCDEEPLGSEEEFAQEVRELVADEAPQVFALVEEHGVRFDGQIIAWGVAFDDHVEVLGVEGGLRASFSSTDQVEWMFSHRRKIRLVWTCPAPSGRPEQVSAVAK